MNKWILVGVAVVAIVIFLNGGFNLFETTTESDETISIPLFEISENAEFYTYETIKYFAVKASDGTIKTGFDACDVCYASKKGYKQEGDDMVCNNCGNRYPILGLGTENKNPGGCWPGYLPSKIEGNNLVIKVSDLEAGKSRFT